jgi:hypothetical protein
VKGGWLSPASSQHEQGRVRRHGEEMEGANDDDGSWLAAW